MEQTNPTLSMHLYKLMSFLATKRQETTLQQLDQFMKILNAIVPRLKGGGKTRIGQVAEHDDVKGFENARDVTM